ncbi:putative Mg(2+) transport ATPase [Planococcus massiliensis]|uniref:Putative Mg(2+) transport ATPase n=1 Tax=Planococcus massiliensis TaxID=1499687 RepID=A0A098EIN5_9BACL|nr:MgtC/SapB family protein [Planococcus massiliensis]CEG21667.1 putative Mg(2+) transport ATPase [Planococcus massiliensis]
MDFLPHDYAVIAGRLLLSAFLSGIIGVERESKQQPAGLRTHLLVGTGSCLMMILSVTGFDLFIQNDDENIRYDPSRIPSYVISGIGFLGAGTIIVQRGSVRGLTTAASIWVAAGVGLVTGIGMYYVALLATLIVLITLYVLEKLEKKYFSFHRQKEMLVIAEDRENSFKQISESFEENGLSILDFQIESLEAYSDRKVSGYTFIFSEGQLKKEMEVIKALQRLDFVYHIKI